MMLLTKYQGSRPCGFRQEDVFKFYYISLSHYVTPRAGPFCFYLLIHYLFIYIYLFISK